MNENTFLQATDFIDHDLAEVREQALRITAQQHSPVGRAVAIYHYVRDNWRYNPLNISFDPSAYRSSRIQQRSEGHCLDKAILMIAYLRAVHIPARLCLAKVRNHIAVEKLSQALGTDELVPHGYVEVYLNEQWVKATPAFNAGLCRHLGVEPLAFDGTEDSIFQAFDREGGKFMEYLDDYGHFADVPVDRIVALIQEHYPTLALSIERGERLALD